MDLDLRTLSEYHPDFFHVFEEPDHAVVLLSSDKVKFRVNSTFLRGSSAFFTRRLSLPQPEGPEGVIDCPEEDSTTIESILKIITGKEYPKFSTVQEVTPIALAAEKWIMLGVLSFLRMQLLFDVTFALAAPLDLYWLGCRLKWNDVAKLASKHSCDKDVYAGANLYPALSRLDAADLWRLTQFHRARRHEMEKIWRDNAPPMYSLTDECHFWRGDGANPLLERDLRWLLHFVDNFPASSPPTKTEIQRMQNRSADNFVCPSCGRSRSYNPPDISSFLLEQWPNLLQSV